MEAESPLDSGTGRRRVRRQPRTRFQGARAGARIRPCPPRRRAESPQYHQTQMPKPRPRLPALPGLRLTGSPKTPGVVIPTTEEGTGYHSLEVFTKTQVPEPPTTAPRPPRPPPYRYHQRHRCRNPRPANRSRRPRLPLPPEPHDQVIHLPEYHNDRENPAPPHSDNHDQAMSDPPIVGPTNKIAKILRPGPRLRRALPRRRHQLRNPSQDAQPLCGRRRPA